MLKYRSVIVQSESLHRVINYEGSLVIVDEAESILSQLTGGVSYKQRAHHCFINLLTTSNNNIVMDALLQ